MLSTACCSIRRASASKRSGIVAKLPPLARLRRGPAIAARLAKEAHRLLDQFAGQSHVGVPLRRAGRACARAAPAARGPDARARIDPLAKCQQPFEDVIDRQVARRRPAPCGPRRTAWRITSTTVVVLPVPGGPWIRPTSRAERANCTASRCDSLRDAVQRPDGRIDAELRLPHAQQHVAQDRKAVAAEHAGLLQAPPAAAAMATSSNAASSRHASWSPSSSGRPSRATEIDDSLRSQTTPRWETSARSLCGESTTGLPTSSRVQAAAL